MYICDQVNWSGNANQLLANKLALNTAWRPMRSDDWFLGPFTLK